MKLTPNRVGAVFVAGLAVVAGLVAINTTDASPFPTLANTGPGSAQLTPYTGPSTITQCGVVIDHKDVPFGLDIRAGNGSRAITDNESASKAQACVVIINSKVHGVIDTRWTGYHTPTYGPVHIADTEVIGDGTDNAALTETNIHVWRSYVHGNRSGMQCDGFCEVHDSYVVADTEVGAAHMDAFITNGNYGNPLLLDHSTWLCQPKFGGAVQQGAGCAAAIGLFGDFSPITNVTVRNNQVLGETENAFCLRTGQDQSGNGGGHKPYPNGSNDTWTGNVFPKAATGTSCNVVPPDWTPSHSAAQHDVWCNNTTDGHTLSYPAAETCAPGTTTTSGPAPTTTSLPVPTTTVAPTTTTVLPVTTTVPVTTTTSPAPTTTTTVPAPDTFTVTLTCSTSQRTCKVS